MGYPRGKKGWCVYDLEKGEYFISRDVVFHENIFPYSTSENTVSCREEGPPQVDCIHFDDVDDKVSVGERLEEKGQG